MKLIARTEIRIIMPAGTQSHGLVSRMVKDCASLSICPQLAVGGCTPKPRKLVIRLICEDKGF